MTANDCQAEDQESKFPGGTIKPTDTTPDAHQEDNLNVNDESESEPASNVISINSRRASTPKALIPLSYDVDDTTLCDQTVHFELDVVGFVQRLEMHLRSRFAFCPELDIWYEWDGKVWRADKNDLRVQNAALRVARSIKDVEAWLARESEKGIVQLKATIAELISKGASTDELDKVRSKLNARRAAVSKQFIAFSESCQRGMPLREGIKALRIDLAVSEREWGGPDDKLNVQNGVLDLRTGALEPHDKKLRFTQITPVGYRPGARHHTLDKVLDHLSDSRPEVTGFMQRYYGTSLTGMVSFASVLYVYGESQVGKSTLVNAVARTLGEGFDPDVSFATEVKAAAFVMSNTSHDEGYHHLRPYRMVAVSEAGTQGMLDAGKLNAVTGGDLASTRGIYGQTVKWVPRMSIIMTANPKARIPVENKGLRERFLPYEVTRKLAAAQRSDAVKQDLKSVAGMEAILAWAVEGAIAWLADGANQAALKIPALIENEKAGYTKDMDPVQDWINDNVILVDPSHSTGFPFRSKEIWDDFQAYVGKGKFPKGKLFEALEEKGFPRTEKRIRWEITMPNGEKQRTSYPETFIPGLFLRNGFFEDGTGVGPLNGNIPLNSDDAPVTSNYHHNSLGKVQGATAA